MLPQKFFDVLKHEGVVSLTTWGRDVPHVTNTWNSYLVITDDERILAPAAGMHHLEEDLAVNDRIIVTLGAREVEGRNGYQGTGFRVEGKARLVSEGKEFDMMKEKYPFLRSVLEITAETAVQLLEGGKRNAAVTQDICKNPAGIFQHYRTYVLCSFQTLECLQL